MRKLGYVQSAEVIRGDGPQARLLVTYIAGTGSGWFKEDSAVLGFDGDSVTVLWDGTTLERSYQSPTVGAYELRGSVELLGADTVVYRTERVELQYDETADAWQPLDATRTRGIERYVWVPASGRFEPFRGR